MLQLFFYCSLALLTKNFEYLSNNVLGQDGLICDDVGCRRGFNKGGDKIYDVGLDHNKILEGMVYNNQVVPPHVAPIGSSVILVDGGSIP